MFLGLLDPNPDPLVRGMDPDLSIVNGFLLLCDFFLNFLSLKNDANVH